MKAEPKVGMSAIRHLTVDRSNRIPFVETRLPAVLATPFLIAELEYAARDAVAPCLEAHEQTLGTYVEVEHLAPVPEGFSVQCKAKVIHVSGASITFKVEAFDAVETVAKGIHRRHVVDVDRFARRVAKKRGTA